MKNVYLILLYLLFFLPSGFGQVVSFLQDQYRGGVTGCGYGLSPYSGGTGVFTINIAPGSTIRKAWLFAGREGPANNVTVTLDGSPFRFDNSNQVTSTFMTYVYGGASAVHAIDVSSVIRATSSAYTLSVPDQSQLINRYEDFYLYVQYANPNLPVITSCIFLNESDFTTRMSSTLTLNYPVDKPKDVSFAVYGGYMCGPGDHGTLFVNDTLLGEIYGPNANSGECGGPFGDFGYQNGTMSGLLDSRPDQAMNGPDALSNINRLISNCAGSIPVTFTSVNNDNALWGYFLTYGATTTHHTDTQGCANYTLQLYTSTESGDAVWSPASGLSCTTCHDPIANPSQTTMYIATITGAGCSNATLYDTITVAIPAAVSVSVQDRSTCRGHGTLLTATPSIGGGTYLWYPTGDSTQSITATPDSTGIYILTYTSPHCGSARDTATVTVRDKSASRRSQTICAGMTVTIDGETISASGTYADTLINAAGCDSIVTTDLTVLPRSYQSSDAKICEGDVYVWRGKTLSVPGTYYDTLSNSQGCDSVMIVKLTTVSRPVAHFAISPSESNITAGNIYAIEDSYADSIFWRLNGKAIVIPASGALLIKDTGSYCLMLVALSSAGCSDTAQECFYVYNRVFFLPNAFTPNGDGTNDFIALSGDKTSMQYLAIAIYDRWGEKIFESNDLDFQWDGTYIGEISEPGVFTYQLDLVYIAGPEIHNTGSITLIR